MAEYVKENFDNFIPEKSVKEAVFVPNPRPDNLVPGEKLDEFLSDLTKERRKNTELAFEAILEKVQNKNLDIMGPLARLWLAVEKVNNHKGDEPPPQLLVYEAQQLIEQTVLLVGQSQILILYERRKNVMSCVMTANAVSSTLKDKADDLANSGKLLFGNDFN